MQVGRGKKRENGGKCIKKDGWLRWLADPLLRLQERARVEPETRPNEMTTDPPCVLQSFPD